MGIIVFTCKTINGQKSYAIAYTCAHQNISKEKLNNNKKKNNNKPIHTDGNCLSFILETPKLHLTGNAYTRIRTYREREFSQMWGSRTTTVRKTEKVRTGKRTVTKDERQTETTAGWNESVHRSIHVWDGRTKSPAPKIRKYVCERDLF